MSDTWSPYGRRRPLFRAFGFPVYVPWSAWLGIALVAYVNAPTFTLYGGLVATVCFAAGLYATVLVHELAHAFVARATRHQVIGIELGILGGATAYQPEAHPNPKHELRVAIAGPLASLVSGLLLDGLARIVDGVGARDAAVVLSALGFMNVFLAALNLLPSAPLDGGHVCEALIWRFTRSRRTGMRITAIFGYVLGTVALWYGVAVTESVNGPLLMFIGLIMMMNSAVLWRHSRSPRLR